MSDPTERALLEHIRADRDSVEPRLVYADWLSERGDPRGEFVHVQCRLSEMEDLDPDRPTLEDRERELLDALGSEWRRAAKEIGTAAELRRGFVETVAVDIDVFLDDPDRVLNVGPVRCVKLHGNANSVPALADCPALERLEGLSLSSVGLGKGRAAKLLASPYLGNLAELNLAHTGLGVAGFQALAGCESLVGLRRLNVEKTTCRGRALDLFSEWPLLRQVEQLNVENNWVNTPELARRLSSLRVVQLGESQFRVGHLPPECRLQSIFASRGSLWDEQLALAAEAGVLSELESLVLPGWYGDPDSDALARILRGADLPRLRRLAFVGLADDGLDAILTAPWADQLRSLNFSQNAFSESAIERLMDADLPELQEVDVGADRNQFSTEFTERIQVWMVERGFRIPNARRLFERLWM